MAEQTLFLRTKMTRAGLFPKKLYMILKESVQIKAAQKMISFASDGLKKRGMGGRFIFISEFLLSIFYAKFQEIKIKHRLPFVLCVIGQQKILKQTLKSESTVFIAISSLNGIAFTDESNINTKTLQGIKTEKIKQKFFSGNFKNRGGRGRKTKNLFCAA